MDTVKLGAARSAYVVRELYRQAPDFVDYPLLALWEMGLRDLRVPLDDAETRSRMVELAASVTALPRIPTEFPRAERAGH